MPTRHPRHSITETPPVREALDSLRRRGERVRLDDLVIRGARDRLREIEVGRGEEAEKAELRRELIEQLRTDYDTIVEHTSLSFPSVWVAPPGDIG